MPVTETLEVQTDKTSGTLPERASWQASAQQPRRRFRRLTTIDVLVACTAFGMAAGLIESVCFAVRRHLMGQLVFVSDDLFWCSSLVHTAVALVIGIPLILTAARSRYGTETLVIVPLTFLLAWNSLLLVPKIHVLAELILAGGIAASTSRWIDHHPGRLLRYVRRVTPYLVASVATLWAVVCLLPRLQEQRAEAVLADAPDHAPNILLIVLDTVSADVVQLDGDYSLTPTLQSLARRGWNFERAYSTCPWTLPAHASLLTGRWRHELSSTWKTPLDRQYLSIAEWLKHRGYRTGGFVGNTVYGSAETGLDRGFIRFEDYGRSPAQLLMLTAWGRYLLKDTWLTVRLGCSDLLARRRAPDICNRFLKWVDDTNGRPYFAMLNFFDAHDPYVAPSDFRRYSPKTLKERVLHKYWWIVDKQLVTDEQVSVERRSYEDCVASLDFQLGQLLSTLDIRGQLDNTLVIVTSDHGEHLGDHDLYGHGNSLYEALIHVPLIVWQKEMPRPGTTLTTPLSLRALPVSIAEQVDPSGPHPFPGSSFLGSSTSLSPPPTEDQPIFSAVLGPPKWPPCGGRSPVFQGELRCVIHREHKYILNGDNSEEVYHLADDPDELHNMVDDVAPERLNHLRQLLKTANRLKVGQH